MKKNAKTLRLIQAASAGVLSLGLVAIPFSGSASAQDNSNPDGTAIPGVEDVEFDWGLLGLLGLLGLAGLAGKKRDEHRHDHHEHHTDRLTGTPANYQSNVSPSAANPPADAPRYRDPYQDPRA